MNVVSGIVVFSVIWWLVLFVVLPFGVQVEATPEKGMATSAPKKANIGKKLAITTAITIVLWFLAFWLISLNLLELE